MIHSDNTWGFTPYPAGAAPLRPSPTTKPFYEGTPKTYCPSRWSGSSLREGPKRKCLLEWAVTG
jgi:hypothetical protein